jgi:hypothetical protein
MLILLKTIIPFLSAFTALGLAFIAVRIGLRATPQPDPFSQAFGEMPGFTAEQLQRLAPVPRTDDPLRRPGRTNSPSAGLALRPDAGSVRLQPTGPDAARIDPTEVFEGCWRRPRG